MELDQILVALQKQGVISGEKSQEIQEKAQSLNKSVEEYLLEQPVVPQEALTQARGSVYNIPYIDLTGKRIEQEVLRLIPEDIANNYKVVAFQKAENEVNVGMVDPRNFKALEAVEFLMKQRDLQPYYYIVSENNFETLIKQYSGLGEEVSEVLDVAKQKFGEEEEDEEFEVDGEIGEVIKRAPVSKIVSIIIKHAIDSRASDIHIEPQPDASRVRYRIDGIMHESLQIPSYLHASVVSRIKVLADLKLDETRKPQDGRIHFKVGKNRVDLRISTLPLVETEKVVMRILDTSGIVPTLKDLGYRETNIKQIEESMRRSYGMFLVTGPTGAGKSTTLYSVLNILNEDKVNIMTLEDPAEFFLPGVNQSQVNPQVGFTFASGLRSMLRQDPDILMVGEIRDKETAELAINAALTGHLLFSTLHTTNALGAMPRLIDMGMEPYLLAATLGSVIAQRLVRKICEHCKVDIDVPKDLEARIRKELESIPKSEQPQEILKKKKLVFYRGNGCVRCGDTGYLGRTSIAEVVVVDEVMKEIIASGAGLLALEKAAKEQGMITMSQDGFLRALNGITTVEEVLRVMHE